MDDETYSQDGAICPHCGRLNKAEDSEGSLYDEMRDEWECEGCGETFAVSLYVSHSWTCKRLDAA
jgi:ribosomal protein L37AE/L43A